jgi:four helix bundle protein
MRSSKSQAPSSKEAPSSKLQYGRSRALGESRDSLSSWGYETGTNGEAVLRDAPITESEQHPFDFEERTARFGEAMVRFSKRIPHSPTNNRLIDQLVGAATSIGANYCEANESATAKDFRYIITRCLKEAKETRHFLRMVLARGDGVDSDTVHDERQMKLQIPNPKFQRSSKLQAPMGCGGSRAFGVWSLGFGASLELGTWILEL